MSKLDLTSEPRPGPPHAHASERAGLLALTVHAPRLARAPRRRASGTSHTRQCRSATATAPPSAPRRPTSRPKPPPESRPRCRGPAPSSGGARGSRPSSSG
eukprot:2460598-Rhodomonas_salina.2